MRFDDKEFAEILEILKQALKGMGMKQEEIDELTCLHNIELPKNSLTENNIQKAIFIKQSANEKFSKENYNEAKELYSSAIILDGIDDHLLAVLYLNRSLTCLKMHRLQKNGNDRNLCRALSAAYQTVQLDSSWHKKKQSFIKNGFRFNQVRLINSCLLLFNELV